VLGIVLGIELFSIIKKMRRDKMPAQKRHKTKYPGVYYIDGKTIGSNKNERIYYIVYRKNGKIIDEKAGRQFQDDMTPARAAQVRTNRIQGKELSNKEKRKAEKAAREAEKKRWTVTRLWDEYKDRNPRLKGIVTDQNRFEKHIKPKIGDKEPKDIIPLDVDRLRIQLLKKRAPGTVKNVLELLRRITNFGEKKRLCPGINFTIEMPRNDNVKTEDLTPKQLSKLLEAIEKDTNIQAANMMKLALFTGMRRGEMFKLKWRDVDFNRGFINIRDPKGGPDQKIPINDVARDLLKSHPRTKSKYVFPGRGGRQRTDIKHQVNRIKEEAGLPTDFRALHGLRHVYASMLASSGEVGMYTLQKLLTHKSPQMTQRYAHLRDEALKQASKLAGDIVTQASKQNSDKKVVSLDDHKE
jgi:integrase